MREMYRKAGTYARNELGGGRGPRMSKFTEEAKPERHTANSSGTPSQTPFEATLKRSPLHLRGDLPCAG